MYSASKNFIEMMSTNKGVLTSRLIVRSNTDLQENIIESRQIYSVHCEKASCENGVTVGGLVLPKLDITVSGDAIPFDLKQSDDVTWEVGLSEDGEKYEFVPVCTAEIVNVKKSGEQYKLETQSKYHVLDQTYTSQLSYPTSIFNVINEISNYFSLKIDPAGLIDFLVNTRPSGYTAREIICSAAERSGTFAVVDRTDSVLSFKWFENTDFTLPTDCISEIEFDEEPVVYNGVICTDGSNSVSYGAPPYMYLTNTLGFVKSGPQLSVVFDKISGIGGFQSGKVNMVLGNILLDTWDIVNIEQDGKQISIPICSLNHDYDGGLTSEITIFGTADENSEVSSVTRIVDRIVQAAVNESKTDIQKDIEYAVEAAAKEIRGGANGFFHIVTDGNGINKETIWCDNIDPYKAMCGIRINRAGIGFWSKEQDPEHNIFNGTYTQAWTIDGSLIADFIRAGTLKGIRVECDNGLLAGWTVEKDCILSPDSNIRLESTYKEPLTTHGYLTSNSYKHSKLNELTHEQIRYMRSVTKGSSRIISKNGSSKMDISGGEIRFYNNDIPQLFVNKRGLDLYGNGKNIGYIGINHIEGQPDNMGLTFDLETAAQFMMWSYRNKPADSIYTTAMAWFRDRGLRFYSPAGFLGDLKVFSGNTADVYRDIDMHHWNINNVDINVESDISLKENVQPCTVKALDIINSIQLFSYDWKESKEHEDIGFIAQQLSRCDPTFVDKKSDILTVRLLRLIPYLVKAIQDLSSLMGLDIHKYVLGDDKRIVNKIRKEEKYD